MSSDAHAPSNGMPLVSGKNAQKNKAFVKPQMAKTK